MFLIGLRIASILAIAYLFGLLIAWLLSLLSRSEDGGDGWDFDGDDPNSPTPPGSGKKRLVEVDEYYYLQEFDLRNEK